MHSGVRRLVWQTTIEIKSPGRAKVASRVAVPSNSRIGTKTNKRAALAKRAVRAAAANRADDNKDNKKVEVSQNGVRVRVKGLVGSRATQGKVKGLVDSRATQGKVKGLVASRANQSRAELNPSAVRVRDPRVPQAVSGNFPEVAGRTCPATSLGSAIGASVARRDGLPKPFWPTLATRSP